MWAFRRTHGGLSNYDLQVISLSSSSLSLCRIYKLLICDCIADVVKFSATSVGKQILNAVATGIMGLGSASYGG